MTCAHRLASSWTPWLLLAAVACGEPSASPQPDLGASAAGGQPPLGGQPATGGAGGGAAASSGGSGVLPSGGVGGAAGMTAGAAGIGGGGGAGGAGGMDDPEACRGFSFEGLVYSPGGTVLPNKCEPFHPTTNNPYAVRCVDAWPWYETEFPGDDFCILPPDPAKGVQYGVHPQGEAWFEQVSKGDMSGYQNLSTDWLVDGGEEEQRNYTTELDHPEFNYYRNYARMRGGSHHMIVSSAGASVERGVWGPGGPDFLAVSLPGAQRPDENAPKSLEKPAEDMGLYAVMPSPTGVTFNMHHFNAGETPVLKEAWTNLWFEDDATIRINPIFGLNFGQAAGLAVAPGETIDLHYSWDIGSPMRMVMAFGHRHVWTTNFSAWVVKPQGEIDILYQSFNWLDEPTYRYDSLTTNPTPNALMRADGAASGLRMLNAGETLHFNCHIEYTDERAAQAEGAPLPAENGTLGFANEAFTAEMCILFGSTTGGSLLSPAVDNSALPDFAK